MIPRYWVNEVSGRMKEIVLKFFHAEKVEGQDLQILKDYIKEWLDASRLPMNERVRLNDELKQITSSYKLMEFNQRLLEYGIDPF